MTAKELYEMLKEIGAEDYELKTSLGETEDFEVYKTDLGDYVEIW